MEENVMIPEANATAQTRYCALEYRSPESDCAPPNAENLLLLLLAKPGETPLVLLNPQWRTICRNADHAYIEELFRDFSERIQVDPDGLFAQASELSVGPLITYCAGRSVEGICWLGDLRDRFMGS